MASRRTAAQRPALPQTLPQPGRGQTPRRATQDKPSTASGNAGSFAEYTRRAGRYGALPKALSRAAAGKPPQDITAADIAAACALITPGHSHGYRYTLHKELRKLCDLAGVPAAAKAGIPKLASPQPRTVIVPEALFERTLRCAPPWLEVILLLTHEAGLRAGTAREVCRGNCDFAARRITGPSKQGSIYDVPMTNRLHDRLLWWAAAAPDAVTPFTSLFKRGGMPAHSTISQALTASRKEAGCALHWTIHDVRRTAARQLYESSGDIRKVQSFLGHRMLWTTCWYLGISLQTLTHADLEEAIGRKEQIA